MNKSNFIFHRNSVIAGKKHYYILDTKELPKTLHFGTLQEFLTSSYPIDIHMNIVPLDDSKMLELLDMESETLEPELKSLKPNSSIYKKIERKLQTTRALQEYIINGKGHLFQLSLTFFTKSENENMLRLSKNFIIKEGKKKIFNLIIPYFEMKKHFMKIFPVEINVQTNQHHIHTHAAGTLFPFLVDYVQMDNGIFFGINDKNKTPVIFNRWAFPSTHSIIAGTTGFGKSYFVKLMIIRELINDESLSVFIIDPLGEYSKLVKLLNGVVINPEKFGNEINIFELGNEKNVYEKIFRLRTIFSLLLDLNKNDLALIDSALSELYSKRTDPIFSDFIDSLKKFNDSRSIEISYILEKLLNGSLKSLNSKTNLKIDKKIVSFDLSKLNEEFMTFYMALILDYIYGKISSNFDKKMVIIDESWKILQNEYASRFLDTMFRHVRRWKCSMNIISQKADDFLQNNYGKSIMNNALFHIIFKHGYISDDMRLFYRFSEAEEEYILSAEKPKESGHSQAYFISNPLRFPLKVISTKEENEVITTDPDELKNVENI